MSGIYTLFDSKEQNGGIMLITSEKKGIMTQVHYMPVYHHPYFGGLIGNEKLPGAEQFFIMPHSLISDDDRDRTKSSDR